MFDKEKEKLTNNKDSVAKKIDNLVNQQICLVNQALEADEAITESDLKQQNISFLKRLWIMLAGIDILLFIALFIFPNNSFISFPSPIKYLALGSFYCVIAFIGSNISIPKLNDIRNKKSLTKEEKQELKERIRLSKERCLSINNEIQPLREEYKEYQNKLATLDNFLKYLGEILEVEESKISVEEALREELLEDFNSFITEKVDYSKVHLKDNYEINDIKLKKLVR